MLAAIESNSHAVVQEPGGERLSAALVPSLEHLIIQGADRGLIF
jgi:hypothetical protein